MKLWIGAELDIDVAEHFRLACNELDDELAEYLKPKEYELELDSLDCIAIIRNDSFFAEVHRYSPKRRDMDFRLVIDFQTFKESSFESRKALILEMLLRAVDILSSKRAVSKTESAKLKADLMDFGIFKCLIRT